MTSHLDDNMLRLFAAGRLDPKRDAQIESHLTDCTECLERLHRIETEQPSRLVQGIKSARLDDEAESETIGIKAVGEISEFIPGDRIGGNYRLEEQVGRGGMGIAWKAYDETAHRYVVLKFVPKNLCSFTEHAAEAMASVRESFQKVHALQHQNICPLYGLFKDPKHGLFLVMKFVDGLTLSEYRKQQVRQHGAISIENIVEILTSIADGLDYAHRQKVVHRDIKPQNIMISLKDGVQIIDFGLADEIHESQSQSEKPAVMRITGTRSYMAPEQWEGRKQDAKTDQYALAVTAYELLAGHVPFSGNDTEILKSTVLHNSPTPIFDLPEHVNATLLKGLAKNPSDRFSSCKDFVKALAKTPSHSRRWLTPAIRICTIMILSVAVYFTVHSYLKPPVDTDSPAIQLNSDTAVSNTDTHVENRQILLPAELASDSNHKEFWQAEPKEKNVGPSEQSQQSSGLLPQRKEELNVLRVVLSIEADGSGQITAKRGKSSEPLFPFQGTQFNSHAFETGMAFRGEIPGMGRMMFPTGYPLIDKSSYIDALPTNRSHGWEYGSFGETYDPVRRLARFRKPVVEKFAGFYLDKAGELPFAITCEVIDDYDCPPDFIFAVYRDSQDKSASATIYCHSERDAMNQLHLNACYADPTMDGTRPLRADEMVLKKGMALTRPFRLSPDIAEEVKMICCVLQVSQSVPEKKQSEFDLTLLDMVGRFKGDVGFRIEAREGKAIVSKDEWSYPVPSLTDNKGHPKNYIRPGDTILDINGQSGSAETLQNILDSLNFGDSVTVRYVSKFDGNAKTTRFHAE